MGKAPKPPKPDPAPPGGGGDDWWMMWPHLVGLGGGVGGGNAMPQQNNGAIPNQISSQGSTSSPAGFQGTMASQRQGPPMMGTMPIIESSSVTGLSGDRTDFSPLGAIPPIGTDRYPRTSMSAHGMYATDGIEGFQFELGVPPPGWVLGVWDCWSAAFWDYLIGQMRRLQDPSQAFDASWHIADMIRRCPRGWVTRVLKSERDTTEDVATKTALDLILNEDFPCKWALNELKQARLALAGWYPQGGKGVWKQKEKVLTALRVLYYYNCYDVASDSHNTSEAAFLRNAIKEIENEAEGWTSHGWDWLDMAIKKIEAIKGEKADHEKKKGK